MNRLILIFILALLAPSALACDETCRRDKAMTEHKVTFPSYLDSKYCKTTNVDFLVGARKSLQKYYDERLNSAHRGGIRNIRNFLEQRKEWLLECDKYLSLTDQGRIFRTKSNTDEIFGAMTSLSDELNRLIGIRSVANEDGYELTASSRQRFEHLFKLVDAHRTDLQLRGQL
jgi:hypothetical protein